MDINKYKELFISECREKLDKMENLIVVLEKEPKNRDLINEIFRDAHSIKGMASTMGYKNMSELSHAIENVFHKIRKDELDIAEDVIDILIRSIGFLKGTLAQIVEKDSDEGIGSKIFEELEALTKSRVALTLRDPEPQTKLNVSKLQRDPFVRVRAKHLDRLIDTLSEFMALRSRFQIFVSKGNIDELSYSLSDLEKLNSDLNEKVLAMRLMPINMLTGKLPRLVRDMEKELGKSVSLEIGGESIELDKNIIESLEAPVIHLIRNCVDHGIEFPEGRHDLGKKAEGNVFFKAYRYQNKVVIEIGDDGRGIDLDQVINKIMEAGVFKKEDLRKMDRDKKLLLICAPGLSTAKKVSELSGRGVGMDVVKSSIESMGGTLTIFSEQHMGTTYKIILPLTSAIIRVFKVEINGIEYGIPVNEIDRVIEIERIEQIIEDGIPYYEPGEGFEGKIRIYDLAKILVREGQTEDKNVFEAVIIKGDIESRVFKVSRLIGVDEVIVKPLSMTLKNVKGVAGVTVLPTGKPMFILNAQELV